jgi:hypothetical protein
MPKGDPPVRLNPAAYEAWISENPKIVDGGPIELVADLDYDDEDAVILEAHHVNSQILPKHYADKTIIMGEYNDFTGFKIYVTPQGYDYLLMAHQTHPEGEFITADGGRYGNHPHFHELDLYRSRSENEPETRRIVTDKLNEGITSAELLEAFMIKYYLDDNRTHPIQSPIRNGRQRGLDEFGN